MPETPLNRLRRLLARAPRTAAAEPTAAILATAAASGAPSVRTVLVKTVDTRGCVFFTSLHSRKARELSANPRAALCFYWEALGMQVIVEGRVEPVTAAETDAYWQTRPRRSQLGAWASKQSAVLPGRGTLLARLGTVSRRFAGGPVPRPPFWTGFRVVASRIEFWTRRPYRLHDRQAFVLERGRWVSHRLFP